MKIQVTQENLNKALSHVSRVTSSRSALPILSHVLLKTDNHRLKLCATNLEMAISITIGSKTTSEGSITVPSRLFTDFIGSLPTGNIELEANEAKLKIKLGSYNSTINGSLADEYPALPEVNPTNKVKLNPSDFKKALQQVLPAASHDETRPILTGVLFSTFEGNLYIAATDSYRLAEKKVAACSQEVNIVIPAASLQELLRMIGDTTDEIVFSYDEQQASFVFAETELTSRLIDGKYPDYRQLIPKDQDSNFVISRQEMISIVRVSSLFARESAGSITLNINEDTSQVEIQSIASQVGENKASAEAQISGSGTVTLNSKYLIDALNAIEGEMVRFSFGTKVSPCVLTADEKSADYQHIIMPLRS